MPNLLLFSKQNIYLFINRKTQIMRLLLLLFILLGLTTINAQNYCSHYNTNNKAASSDSIDVLHYSINLDIIYLSQQKIAGYTALKIIPKYDNTNNISLDLQNLIVDSIFIGNNEITNWTYNDTLISIPLSITINTTDTSELLVYYHGNPQKDPSGWGGFYFSSDSTFAFNMAVGMQDDPHNYGRIWYPCVDNFTDRATYDFAITVKNNNTVICNGTLKNQVNNPNTDTYIWELHDNIPTYLASIAIGPYVAVHDSFNSINGSVIPIDIYVPQNKVASVSGSFANLKQILDAFEQYYGPYRWERIGYVGVPFNGGAMEHATSIHIGLGDIDGTTNSETLIAHELSHHWFGDLVTCSSAPDMWLNEGWASFSESMYQEYVYGREAYVDYMRDMHYNVLKSAHNADNGYRAVAGVPHEYTYGSTVYKKGATIAHSLRGYLGDDKFFSMLNAYMGQKAFMDQSSTDFRDFITSNTGVNMNDWFDAWVFEAGFSEFYANSMTITPNSSTFKANISARQGLHHKPNFANSNRMPITFMDDAWNRKDTFLQFSGQAGSEEFYLNFEPTVVFTDLNNTVADATIDYNIIIKNTGSHDYSKALFKMDVKSINDSALFQITHHWAAPDTLGTSYPGLRISTKRYWTVAANNTSNFNIKGSFRYWKSAWLDNDIILSSQDSIVLLYRADANTAWHKISFERQGNWVTGFLIVDNIQPGEYSVAAYDYNYLGLENNANIQKEIELSISPNPGSGKFYFEGNFIFPTSAAIFDSTGKQIHTFEFETDNKHSYYKWNSEGYAAGTYFIAVFTNDNTLIYQSKLIKTN